MILVANVIIFSSIILGSIIQRQGIKDFRQPISNESILMEHSYALPFQQSDVFSDNEDTSNSQFSTEGVKFDSEEYEVSQISFKTSPIDFVNAQGIKKEVIFFNAEEDISVDETDGSDVKMLLDDFSLFENCLEELNLKQDDLFEILEKGQIQFSDAEEGSTDSFKNIEMLLDDAGVNKMDNSSSVKIKDRSEKRKIGLIAQKLVEESKLFLTKNGTNNYEVETEETERLWKNKYLKI